MRVSTRSLDRIFRRRGLWQVKSLEQKIKDLFKDGSQGVWYDPSDLTTLFQDSAGTTPVTALEQSVGLILDKSKGLVLGPELVTNGTFDANVNGWTAYSAAAGGIISWSAGAMIVSNNGGTYARGTSPISTVAGRVYLLTVQVTNVTALATIRATTVADASSGYLATKVSAGVGSHQLIFTATGTTTYVALYVEATGANTATFDSVSVKELPGNHAYQPTSTSRAVLSRRVNLLLATETLATQSVTTQATSYNLRFGGTGSVALSGTATGTYSAGSHTITCTAGSLTVTVSGSVTTAMLIPNDLAALPYQRVTTLTDYDSDSSKFPTFLRTDGVDDGYVTNAIDFSATDKMFVGVGVRKLSDAATGTVVESYDPATPSGRTFGIRAPFSAAANLSFGLTQDGANYAVGAASPFAAPRSMVASGLFDWAQSTNATRVLGRVDGAQQTLSFASSVGTLTSGNFASRKLYLFARGGTSLPFNGEYYGGVIVGKALTAAQIRNVELYLAKATKTVSIPA